MKVRTSTIPAEDFRKVCGQYVTGVAIVTALLEESPIGFSINSFTSVSLDPLLVSFYASNTSSTWVQMKNSAGFAVNILSESQDHLIAKFAQKGIDRFQGITWKSAPITGSPLFNGTVGWIDCRTNRVEEIGDHFLVVGEVVALHASNEEQPLAYHKGRVVSVVKSQN